MWAIVRDITQRKRTEEALRESHDQLDVRVQGRTAELQAANAALRESEQTLRVFLNAVPAPTLLLDRNGTILASNQALLRNLGLPAAEVNGKRIFDLLPADVATGRKTLFEQVIRSREPAQSEDTRAGRHFINLASPVLDLAGNVTSVAVLALDITERKRAELTKEVLLELGTKLSAATTPVEVARAIFASADRVCKWDSAGLDLYNPERDWMEPVLFFDVIDGQRREVAPTFPAGAPPGRLSRILQEGAELILRQPADLQRTEFVRFGDASRLSASLMYVALRREGRPLGILSIQSYTPNAYTREDLRILQLLADQCSGALERIQAEMALRESEQKYRALLETTGTGYIILDLQGRVLEANAEYVRLTGHKTLREILGRTVVEWTAAHDRERNAAELEHCARTGAVRTLEIDYAGPDGVLRPVEINATLVETSKGARVLSLCWDITERKQAEEALRKRDELNRTILATAMDGFFGIDFANDPRGTITEVNDAYCRMTGYCRDELLQMRLTDLEAAETADMVTEHRDRILTTGADQFETRHRCKDGHEIQLDISSSKLAGSDCRTFSFVRDITQRKQAEEALRRSEERYRTLFELSPDGILLEDTNGDVLDANRAICEMLGYSRDEFQRLNVRRFAPPENHSQVEVHLALLRAGQRLTHEVWNLRKDGERRLMWLHEQSIPLPDGRQAILVVTRDITESKKTEEALCQSEERYRSLVNNLNVGVYRNTPGPHGRFIQVNPALARIHGYESPEEFQQARVSDLYQNPGDRETVVAEIMRRSTVLNYELRLKRKDGTPILGSVNATVHRGPDGQVDWIDGMLEDITERKRAESLVQAQRDLGITLSLTSDLNTALDRLLDTAMHISEIDSGGVYLLDRTTETMDLAAHRGVSASFVKAVSHWPSDSPQMQLLRSGRPSFGDPEAPDSARRRSAPRRPAWPSLAPSYTQRSHHRGARLVLSYD